MKTVLAFLFCLLFFVSCADDSSFSKEQLNYISSAHFNKCYISESSEDHYCIFLADPFNRNIKIFDATNQSFVKAPSGFSHLIIQLNNGPLGKITSYDKDAPFVYLLNKGANSIDIIKALTINNSKTQTLTLYDKITLDKGAKDLLMFNDKNNQPWAFVSYPHEENGYLQAIAINKKTGKSDKKIKLSISCPKTPTINCHPHYMTLSADRSKIFFSSSRSSYISSINLNILDSIKKNSAKEISLNITNSIAVGQQLSKKLFPVSYDKNSIIALDQAEKKVYSISFNNDKYKISMVKTSAIPLAAYSSSPQSEPCCGGQKKWIAIVFSNGQMQYYPQQLFNTADNYNRANESIVKLDKNSLLGIQSKFATSMFFGEVPQQEDNQCSQKIFLTTSTGGFAGVCEGSNNDTDVTTFSG